MMKVDRKNIRTAKVTENSDLDAVLSSQADTAPERDKVLADLSNGLEN